MRYELNAQAVERIFLESKTEHSTPNAQHICCISVRLVDHNNQINSEFYVYLIPLEMLGHDSLANWHTDNEQSEKEKKQPNKCCRCLTEICICHRQIQANEFGNKIKKKRVVKLHSWMKKTQRQRCKRYKEHCTIFLYKESTQKR